jgi:dephospho-CoA kinase
MASIPLHPNIVSKKGDFCKRSSDRSAKVIGLTGGIASGKSTVGRMLSKQNFPVIDTDKLAREVVEPGKPALKKLVKAFGTKILKDDKTLDRHRMLEMILTDAGARQLVENIIHPYVFKRMDQILQQLAASGNNIVIVEVPLLFEAGWQDFFDYIISVVAPESICTGRA